MTDSFIEPLVEAIGAVPGIEAIVLGGSRARGDFTPSSDYDLGLYFDSKSPFRVQDLEQAVAPFVDSPSQGSLTRIGEWGPWIVGGGWMSIDGHAVDLLYRSLEEVEAVIDEALDGTIRVDYQPGHPHGFISAIWLAELHYCRLLADPQGRVAHLKQRLDPYPRSLGLALVERLQWEIDFAIGNAAKAIAREDRSYIAGAMFRALACAAQVICAINSTYVMNEKGAIWLAASLPATPDRFVSRVEKVWDHFAHGRFEQATAGLRELDSDIALLVEEWRAVG